ncbi:octanoyltransferase [Desulfoluna limicola]|uniref:Octanoyltransferase n=1 Tax=Desulfoluna limicola TaxID=2810562 RepID=A0ABN6F374_9BACT|nr:lipoyl(octanoyl) transferase LipB [Desulfoluna limicola]BCS95752.1 octanoyltransferase [Desulfoluna limicola]
MKQPCIVAHLGVRGYGEIFHLQKKLSRARQKGIVPDILMFLEHEPCITLGRNARRQHILAEGVELEEKGLRVFETDRGGDVTYHGPGQLVCYPTLNLSNHDGDVIAYTRKLEVLVIRTLNAFGISAGRRDGHPGVWLDRCRKIASLGVSVERNVSTHGIALNVSPDMDHFKVIIPCGLPGVQAVSMEECLGCGVSLTEVMSEMKTHASDIFNLDLQELKEDELMRMVDNVSA